MKKYIYLVLLSYSLLGCIHTEYQDTSRQSLKNYGLAYCLRKQTTDPNLSQEYAKAQGIYFEIGNHTNPEAYKSTRNYIELNVKSNNFKSFEGNNALFSCLEIYNDNNYEALIKELDIYLPPNPN